MTAFLIKNWRTCAWQGVARKLRGLKGTVRDAVNDKHNSGCWCTAGHNCGLAMDVSCAATNGKGRHAHLRQSVYAEFGQSGKR